MEQSLVTQQTRGIHPMLFECSPTVFDAGLTLKQWLYTREGRVATVHWCVGKAYSYGVMDSD